MRHSQSGMTKPYPSPPGILFLSKPPAIRQHQNRITSGIDIAVDNDVLFNQSKKKGSAQSEAGY